MAAIAARLLFVLRQAMNYQKNVSALIKPLSKTPAASVAIR
jgi:hypothetical protein